MPVAHHMRTRSQRSTPISRSIRAASQKHSRCSYIKPALPLKHSRWSPIKPALSQKHSWLCTEALLSHVSIKCSSGSSASSCRSVLISSRRNQILTQCVHFSTSYQPFGPDSGNFSFFFSLYKYYALDSSYYSLRKQAGFPSKSGSLIRQRGSDGLQGA